MTADSLTARDRVRQYEEALRLLDPFDGEDLAVARRELREARQAFAGAPIAVRLRALATELVSIEAEAARLARRVGRFYDLSVDAGVANSFRYADEGLLGSADEVQDLLQRLSGAAARERARLRTAHGDDRGGPALSDRLIGTAAQRFLADLAVSWCARRPVPAPRGDRTAFVAFVRAAWAWAAGSADGPPGLPAAVDWPLRRARCRAWQRRTAYHLEVLAANVGVAAHLGAGRFGSSRERARRLALYLFRRQLRNWPAAAAAARRK